MKFAQALWAIAMGVALLATPSDAQADFGEFEDATRANQVIVENLENGNLLDPAAFMTLSSNTMVCVRFNFREVKAKLAKGQSAELIKANIFLFVAQTAVKGSASPILSISAHNVANSPGGQRCSQFGLTNAKVIYKTTNQQGDETWISGTATPIDVTAVVNEIVSRSDFELDNSIQLVIATEPNSPAGVFRIAASTLSEGPPAMLTQWKRVEGGGSGGDSESGSNASTIFAIAGGAIGVSVLVSFGVYRMNRSSSGTSPNYGGNSFAAGNSFGPGAGQPSSYNYNNSNGALFGKTMMGGPQFSGNNSGGAMLPPPPMGGQPSFFGRLGVPSMKFGKPMGSGVGSNGAAGAPSRGKPTGGFGQKKRGPPGLGKDSPTLVFGQAGHSHEIWAPGQ